jgi:hypothetical protein
VEARKAADDARYSALANAPAASVQNATKPSDFKIYVQYGTGAASQAGEAQKRLQQIGYGAPSPQMVTTATDAPELRYFLPSQAKLAEEVALQMKDVVGAVKPVYFGGKYKIEDGIMELWLPPQGVTTEQAYKQGTALRQFRVDQKVQDMIRQEANKRSSLLRPTSPASAE